MSADFAGWTPVRLDPSGIAPRLDWCFTAGYEFDDPFFDQTIGRCLREPARLLFRRNTDLDLLAELADPLPPPAGLIAHLSRCGSTLVSQMLAHRTDTLALSEPPVIDTMVRTVAGGRRPVADLRRLVAVLGRGEADHHVVKLDAWSTLDFQLFSRAFPDVPWVFLYRDPLEVLVSHTNRAGYHMIPGTLPPAALGLAPDDVARLSPVEYGAAMLGRILRAALHAAQAAPAAPLLLNYVELPAAARIYAHFGLPASLEDEFAAGEIAKWNAKNPVLAFEPDTARKQDEATPTMRDAVDRWARPWYERLEQLRTESAWRYRTR